MLIALLEIGYMQSTQLKFPLKEFVDSCTTIHITWESCLISRPSSLLIRQFDTQLGQIDNTFIFH